MHAIVSQKISNSMSLALVFYTCGQADRAHYAIWLEKCVISLRYIANYVINTSRYSWYSDHITPFNNHDTRGVANDCSIEKVRKRDGNKSGNSICDMHFICVKEQQPNERVSRNGSETLMKNVSRSDALIWNHITENEKQMNVTRTVPERSDISRV